MHEEAVGETVNSEVVEEAMFVEAVEEAIYVEAVEETMQDSVDFKLLLNSGITFHYYPLLIHYST